jgi:hypothetical protein
VSRGEAPEVPLAAEAGPLREDRQGEHLRVGEQGRAARLLASTEKGWCSCHQSSTETYNESRKESRSMRHRLWAKVQCQHKLSAPSPPIPGIMWE